ncbi:FAD/NAD(P)-binding domain-containing protein [Aspergillus varians]
MRLCWPAASMSLKVIIIGAGLSGALLANGLAKNGIETVLYERDQQDTKKEGYLIRLGDGATTGFRACLSESQTATIRRKFSDTDVSSSTAPALYTSSFRLLLDLTRLPSWTKAASINRKILRDELLSPIKTRDLVKFRKAFSHYEIFCDDYGAEKVRVVFADGSSDTCDLLVGADGSASQINAQVGARNLVDITSHWSFHAKGNLPVSHMMRLPKQLLRGPIAVFSKGCQLFYALYVPGASFHQHGAADNISIIDKGDDDPVGSFYWGLHIPKAQIPYEDLTEIPNCRKLVMDQVRDWAPELQTMLSIGSTDEDTEDLYIAKLRASTQPPSNWRDIRQACSTEEGHARVWLIGDAIHCMLPNRGQGGNQALHDCADILPELVALNAQVISGRSLSTEDIRRACVRYEAKMFPRVFAWVKKSGGAVANEVGWERLSARYMACLKDTPINDCSSTLILMA